jgi:hypothetical protein
VTGDQTKENREGYPGIPAFVGPYVGYVSQHGGGRQLSQVQVNNAICGDQPWGSVSIVGIAKFYSMGRLGEIASSVCLRYVGAGQRPTFGA